MDPHSFIARAEAQRWLGIAEKLLMGHDLVGSKTFAIRARESDPRLEAADQILAIADTLLAAEKRVVGNNGAQQPDFYAILQLVRFVQDTEHIASQYRRLAVMLNPHQNRFPYSDQAFQLVNEAYGVLSNPLRKSLYDAELDFQQQQQQQMNHIGFNLEQHQHHHQQQHQHNFFSLNHMASGHHKQELAEPTQTFQTRVHQQQQLQQHNFLSQPNPVRPVPVRDQQEHLFQQQREFHQPQVQPFQITSSPQQQTRPSPQPTPPSPVAPPQPPLSWPQAQPPQPPLSWPQAPPPSQPLPPQAQPKPQPLQQQMPLQPPQQPLVLPPPQPQAPPPPLPPPQAATPPPLQPQTLPPPQPLQPQPQLQKKEVQQEREQRVEEPLEQNATPVRLPSQVNSNNGVSEEEIEGETEEASENVDESPTFWTACPYCLYMYEYPRVYADCTLRCDNCIRAFQAVPVPSPPPIIEGQDAYFCCWGSFPLGVSISHLENNNGTGTNSNWTPFSPFCDVSSNVQDNLNGSVPKKNRSWGPRIYIDDVTDDIFTGISEPSDESDVEWGSTKKKKAKRMKKNPGKKKRAKGQSVKAKDARNKTVENLQNDITVQEGEGASTVPLADSSKKPVASNPRRQSGRVAKELGKLDLNVEFNNNEGEEPAPRMAAGNRGHGGQGEEDNIEGIGFFEGLDEFLSSLPILSVVNDEKGKAA